MYKIKVEAEFSSAHNLRGYKGKCEELHGHNWKVELAAGSKNLDKVGMVLDFKFLKRKLNSVLDKLDHKYLNRVDYFKKANPTSENIAKYIYDRLGDKVPGLVSITVWESEKSCATYDGE
ncbi:MAG: 6-carboxytetrahydropterin synthase QueD [Candidatus Omnitrophica bacterium CG08_land_8_20_14_0_20_41_16]|uniref:6-carboxy-5,6,7,8-tetrahydropterin synthase n=1 Tax=Candidatus Sherwoodlollariibacterium unditelluris TaxID=1974757 RepID=A0A2G9YLF0_9BACT|nr:MAG: 6-carboxytetrahydropterin synthase QueD [Candidatus Omnitrophica bacterium CG23_combo_of_CG06-09_8_20_14_all_41_10]PIS33306.1 MAG: 6-carboxytetrahydropterin synthase QueD [Candidatus Omnitrophica bacterium CG08_land_8_20_14_0_20_41_16]